MVSNYDKSEFEGVLLSLIMMTVSRRYGRNNIPKTILDADNFKSYDELKEKLNRVITQLSLPTQ